MITGDWLKDGAQLQLPVSLPWPRQIKQVDGKWESSPEQGVNVFVLMHEAEKRGYKSALWLTLREGEASGASLKDGAQGVSVASWRWRSTQDGFVGNLASKIGQGVQNALSIDEDDPQAIAMRPVVVFNSEQWEGLERLPVIEYHAPSVSEAMETAEMMEKTEAPCEIKYEAGQKPFYNPSLNYIQMPEKGSYETVKQYYWDLFEQFGHALAGKHNMDLWGGEEQTQELSKDMNFRTLYAQMVAAMLAYEAGIDVLS